jgi:hypothetical protein
MLCYVMFLKYSRNVDKYKNVIDLWNYTCFVFYILALGKRRKSILKVILPLQCDLHVHRAAGAPYWPILACGTRVRVKTRYFEKLKINISTRRIQTKLFR